MQFTRRGLLKGAVTGVGLLTCGGAWLATRKTIIRRPARPLLALDLQAFSILAAVVDRMTPSGDDWPAARDIHVAEDIDALLSRLHPGDAADLVDALNLLESAVAGFALDGRATTFTASAPDVQDRALQDWLHSSITLRRTAFKGLHKLCQSAYFSNPATYERAGYPGPPNFGGGA